MKYLYVIPARGGSKGVPYKNIKSLGGIPLIKYSIDVARELTSDENICISTDDDEIIEVVNSFGIKVPFKRPEYLATDISGTYEVLLHAVEYYEKIGKEYDVLVLLQPTSPFRKANHVEEAIELFDKDLDMVVSVKPAASNPYYNCYEDSPSGFLHISKGNGRYERRQDVPDVWEFNGAIYVINIASLKKMSLSNFIKVKKYVMDEFHSFDIDTPFDWLIAEQLINKNVI